MRFPDNTGELRRLAWRLAPRIMTVVLSGI